MRTTATNRCVHCNKRHNDTMSAKACCLFAPKATGHCAWCGDDVVGNVTFCKQACAISYREDVLSSPQRRTR